MDHVRAGRAGRRQHAAGRHDRGPARGRVSVGRGRPDGAVDARLGSLPGRFAPGRPLRPRAGGPLGGADLDPYRRRAARLAGLLEGDGPLHGLVPVVPPLPVPANGLERRLGLVRVGLEALVADLESVDAVEEELRPLRDLLADLAREAGPAGPGSRRPAPERLRERALAVLRAFAAPVPPAHPSNPAPPARPGRRRDPAFWKR
jgi:hypothetical protein